MTMRRPNYAQQMTELKNEIELVEIFMTPVLREIESLVSASQTRKLSVKEMKRVDELKEYIHDKNVFLKKARKTLKDYYCPVSA